MFCNSECFTSEFEQLIWTPYNLVYFPDDDRDTSRNILVMYSM